MQGGTPCSGAGLRGAQAESYHGMSSSAYATAPVCHGTRIPRHESIRVYHGMSPSVYAIGCHGRSPSPCSQGLIVFYAYLPTRSQTSVLSQCEIYVFMYACMHIRTRPTICVHRSSSYSRHLPRMHSTESSSPSPDNFLPHRGHRAHGTRATR